MNARLRVSEPCHTFIGRPVFAMLHYGPFFPFSFMRHTEINDLTLNPSSGGHQYLAQPGPRGPTCSLFSRRFNTMTLT